MAEKRNSQVVRILRLIQLLQSHRPGFTIAEFKNRLDNEGFNASERTLYRDLEAIEAVHYPIVKDGDAYKFNEELAGSSAIQLNYPEVMALYIIRKSLDTTAENPLKFVLDSLFNKITVALGKGAALIDEDLKAHLDFQISPKWGVNAPSEVMDTIHSACEEGHMLDLEYKSPSSDPDWSYQRYKVGPEYIVFTHDGAYLYGKKIETNGFKLYALPRIRSATMLDEPYDAELKPENRIHKDSFGVMLSGEVNDVELEVAEPIATYLAERKWHSSQQIVRVEKGVRLHLRVRVNEELARWILGLGSSAKVLKPNSLRELVKGIAKDIYSN